MQFDTNNSIIERTDPGNEYYTDERCFINEILNTPSNKGISIAQARVEPGVTTKLHQLDGDEYYYILEGEGFVEISDSVKEKVGKGDVVQIKAGFAQRITNISESDLIFLCVCTPRFKPESYTSLE